MCITNNHDSGYSHFIFHTSRHLHIPANSPACSKEPYNCGKNDFTTLCSRPIKQCPEIHRLQSRDNRSNSKSRYSYCHSSSRGSRYSEDHSCTSRPTDSRRRRPITYYKTTYSQNSIHIDTIETTQKCKEGSSPYTISPNTDDE